MEESVEDWRTVLVNVDLAVFVEVSAVEHGSRHAGKDWANIVDFVLTLGRLLEPVGPLFFRNDPIMVRVSTLQFNRALIDKVGGS
jgi:hypothetical protein